MVQEIISRIGNAVYELRGLRDLPRRKPVICWFPQYRVKVRLADQILNSADSFSAVEQRLTDLKFLLHSEHRHAATFTRGYDWGDFSVKVAKIIIKIILPLERDFEFCIRYGSFMAFDTGDLWRLSVEIRDRLEA